MQAKFNLIHCDHYWNNIELANTMRGHVQWGRSPPRIVLLGFVIFFGPQHFATWSFFEFMARVSNSLVRALHFTINCIITMFKNINPTSSIRGMKNKDSLQTDFINHVFNTSIEMGYTWNMGFILDMAYWKALNIIFQ